MEEELGILHSRFTDLWNRYILVSFVNAAYPCYERGGVPTCPGFRPKEDMREIVDRRAQIARGNEGYQKPKEI